MFDLSTKQDCAVDLGPCVVRLRWRRGRALPSLRVVGSPEALGIFVIGGLLVWVAIYFVVQWLYKALVNLLNPSSSQGAGPDNARPGNFDVSTNDEARLVPVVFGEHKIAPNLLHYVGVRHEPIVQVTEVESGGKGGGSEEVEQVVGHAVFATFLYGLGDRFDAVTGFYLQDELVWSGALTDDQTASMKTGASSQQNGSGHSRSTVRFRQGYQATFPEYAAATGSDIPYFGTSLLWFDDAFVGDNAGSIPNYGVRVRKIVDLLRPGQGKSAIVPDGSASHLIGCNPADILYFVLLEHLGIPAAQIDKASFIAAQQTLFDERMAAYVQIDQANAAEEIISEATRQVDGILYLSHATGKWRFRLIRGDYDEETLPTIGPERMADLEIDRQAWEDLPTEIELKHVDLNRWEMASISMKNPAARFAVGATKKKSVSFPWFGTSEALERIAQRLVTRYWRPIAVVKMTLPANMTHPTTGELWFPEEGDVVKIRHVDPKDRVSFENMIVRIVSTSRGPNEARVTVEAVEDLFAVGGIDLVNLPGADPSNPSYALNDPPAAAVAFDANPELSPVPAAAVLAQHPATGLATGFGVRVDGTYSYGPFELAATARLAAAFPAAKRWADPELAIALDTPSSQLAAFTATPGAWQRVARPAVVELGGGDFELVSVRELVDNGGGSWTMRGIIRDIAGTGWRRDGGGLKAWPDNARVWFLPSRSARAIVPLNGALTVSKSLAVTARNHFDASPPLALSHTYGFTVEKPYPPGLLRAEKIGAGAGQTHRLRWMAHTRHRGATGANMDNMPAFDAPAEGQWEISIPATPAFAPIYVDEPTWDRPSAGTSAVTYRVRSLLNGRFSEHRDVVVAAG